MAQAGAVVLLCSRVLPLHKRLVALAFAIGRQCLVWLRWLRNCYCGLGCMIRRALGARLSAQLLQPRNGGGGYALLRPLRTLQTRGRRTADGEQQPDERHLAAGGSHHQRCEASLVLGVCVCTSCQQRLSDADGNLLVLAVDRRNGVQWRRLAVARLLGVGAGCQQQLHGAFTAAGGGEQQRTAAAARLWVRS